MSLVATMHTSVVAGRRVRTLAERLAALFPRGASVLDIGCGDGAVSRLILDRRPDLTLEGIDVLQRPVTHIPVRLYDGRHVPHPDRSFDAVLFVDVLHHTDDPTVLLGEAARVARQAILIKDHLRDGVLAGPTLRLMDWVGNAHHGVRLPYNYWPKHDWLEAFDKLGLRIDTWEKHLPPYPFPGKLVFGRSLHFIVRLGVPGS